MNFLNTEKNYRETCSTETSAQKMIEPMESHTRVHMSPFQEEDVKSESSEISVGKEEFGFINVQNRAEINCGESEQVRNSEKCVESMLRDSDTKAVKSMQRGSDTKGLENVQSRAATLSVKAEIKGMSAPNASNASLLYTIGPRYGFAMLYICKVCDQLERTKTDLQRHFMLNHKFKGPFKCNAVNCGEEIPEIVEYEEHMLYNHGLILGLSRSTSSGERKMWTVNLSEKEKIIYCNAAKVRTSLTSNVCCFRFKSDISKF